MNSQHIKTKFTATVFCPSDSYDHIEVTEHETREAADDAANTGRVEFQKWLEEHVNPAEADRAAFEGRDPELLTAESRVECVEYLVGDDDITDDPVAQAIAEAAIASGLVRWPVRRDNGKPGRKTRLLFPVNRGTTWAALELRDSEQMIEWFADHKLTYPEIAADAARERRAMMVSQNTVAINNGYTEGAGRELQIAQATVARLERELAAARAALVDAQEAANRARMNADAAIERYAGYVASLRKI